MKKTPGMKKFKSKTPMQDEIIAESKSRGSRLVGGNPDVPKIEMSEIYRGIRSVSGAPPVSRGGFVGDRQQADSVYVARAGKAFREGLKPKVAPKKNKKGKKK